MHKVTLKESTARRAPSNLRCAARHNTVDHAIKGLRSCALNVRDVACFLRLKPLVTEDTESLSRLENRFAALQILSISHDMNPVCALHLHSPNNSSTQHLQVNTYIQVLYAILAANKRSMPADVSCLPLQPHSQPYWCNR
jgi:hypothetical protein